MELTIMELTKSIFKKLFANSQIKKSSACAKTLYDKIWEQHLINENQGNSLIYVDRQLIHEVTSPQAFEGLRINNRKVRRPEAHLAVADLNVTTVVSDRGEGNSGIKDKTAKAFICKAL